LKARTHKPRHGAQKITHAYPTTQNAKTHYQRTAGRFFHTTSVPSLFCLFLSQHIQALLMPLQLQISQSGPFVSSSAAPNSPIRQTQQKNGLAKKTIEISYFIPWHLSLHLIHHYPSTFSSRRKTPGCCRKSGYLKKRVKSREDVQYRRHNLAFGCQQTPTSKCIV
jgi:hypothetical protein